MHNNDKIPPKGTLNVITLIIIIIIIIIIITITIITLCVRVTGKNLCHFFFCPNVNSTKENTPIVKTEFKTLLFILFRLIPQNRLL